MLSLSVKRPGEAVQSIATWAALEPILAAENEGKRFVPRGNRVLAQDIGVQRAQVAFHRYAAFGEPERALERYEARNGWRRAMIEREFGAAGPPSPFVEIGANAGYTSYMLASEFGARGFAADISEDALRQGVALRERWPSAEPPVPLAADAVRLPFQTGSVAFVMSFQLLSQFQDIDPVVAEIHRILAPGGVYFFGDEPVRRQLTAGLFRAPYPEFMPGWQRRLHHAGLLDFLASDVIGAAQEEKVGIRQNHRMGMQDWQALFGKHFAETRFDANLREEGWFNGAIRDGARRWGGSRWRERAAGLLGGALSGFCRKAGTPGPGQERPLLSILACPDCGADLATSNSRMRCVSCGFSASERGQVFNCLPSALRDKLYREEAGEAMDCNSPGHESAIVSGFHELDGSGGNRFRWIGPEARIELRRSWAGPAVLGISGFVHPGNCPVTLEVRVNGARILREQIRDAGAFHLERDVAEASRYRVEIDASPVWRPSGEDRDFTVVLNSVRISER